MTNKQLQDILNVIEGLSLSIMENNFYHKITTNKKKQVVLDYKEINLIINFIDKVYKFSHLAGNCENPHDDWRKELDIEKDKLKEMGLI